MCRRMPDWLVAFDDLLCRRLRRCTDCGRPTADGWCGIWTFASGVDVAYNVCEKCRDREGSEVALRARLEARSLAARAACT